jgi:hypothetical protein
VERRASFAPSLEIYRCLVGEPEPPVRWRDDGLARGVGGELEAERLAAELREGLVRSAPVVAHVDPPGAAAALHPHLPDVAGAGHVRQQPVRVPLQREPFLTHGTLCAVG